MKSTCLLWVEKEQKVCVERRQSRGEVSEERTDSSQTFMPKLLLASFFFEPLANKLAAIFKRQVTVIKAVTSVLVSNTFQSWCISAISTKIRHPVLSNVWLSFSSLCLVSALSQKGGARFACHGNVETSGGGSDGSKV